MLKKHNIIFALLLAIILIAPAQITWAGAVEQAMKAGGDRLVSLQNNDGGWDWYLDDGDPTSGSALNTIGPIGMGLAQVYEEIDKRAYRRALKRVGELLLTKQNNFSPSDGYLAAQLDEVFDRRKYTRHVKKYFYNPLAAGTYDRNGAGTLYDTAGYVNLIRTSRANQGIPNLAAWDVGMGLVGAASAGADTSAWIAGVKAEIDELDGSAYYDVIGLAGAVYGLAFVDEDFDPTSGEHAAASSLRDLAEILASYQIEGGGFAWNSQFVIPNDSNETIQETAYAILALYEFDDDDDDGDSDSDSDSDSDDDGAFAGEIKSAAMYLLSVQLPTGGWENYVGSLSGENNEVTAEALWGISAADSDDDSDSD